MKIREITMPLMEELDPSFQGLSRIKLHFRTLPGSLDSNWEITDVDSDISDGNACFHATLKNRMYTVTEVTQIDGEQHFIVMYYLNGSISRQIGRLDTADEVIAYINQNENQA